MNGLAALVFATPLFGLSLTPPTVTPYLTGESDSPAFGFEVLVPGAGAAYLAGLPMPLLLDMEGTNPAADTVPADDAAAGDEVAEPTAEPEVTAEPAAEPGTASAGEMARLPEEVSAVDEEDLSEEDRRLLSDTALRRDIAAVHRALGISTFIAMTGALIFGLIQNYDLYGFFAPPAEAPCTAGTAVFQEFCVGASWPHRSFVIGTSVLYTATFALSLAMPDPNHVSEGRGAFAERVRGHQILRWIHLAGMVLQSVIGLGIANDWFGDRANNYETLQALAGVHQAIGWTTWFTVGLAGAIMLF